MRKSGVGLSRPRHDAYFQVTGKCKYGADIDMPNMLICKVKRSDRAHAKILDIDISNAEALPGVRAIITGKDIPFNIYGITHMDQPIMVETITRQFSDAIAAVAADTEEIAEEAVKLIMVEYEDLPGVFDAEEAMKPESYKIHGGESNIATTLKINRGDVELAFAESAYILEQHLSTPGIEHASIETHACITYIDEENDQLVIRASAQKPFEIAADTAKALQRPMNSVRVISSAIGGGFGGKNEITIEPLCAALTLKTGCPVRGEFTREDEFNCSSIRHPYKIYYKTGISKEGKILARKVRIVSDSGAYVLWGASTLTKASVHACGPYEIPNTEVEGYLVYTNNPVGGAMRGFGVTQLGFAYEVHTEYCASQIGMDSLAFRKINMIKDGSMLPTGMIMNIVTVEETLDKAIELAKRGGDWE
jgi:CO/xanthine dehydrogenase Mo-binding subunit